MHDVRDVKSGLSNEKTRESLLGVGFAIETVAVVIGSVIIYMMKRQRNRVMREEMEPVMSDQNPRQQLEDVHESNRAFVNENLLDV